MRFSILLFLLLGTSISAQDKPNTKNELRKLYQEYFKNPDQRDQILAQVRAIDAIAKSDTASFTQLAFELARSNGPKLDAKGGRFAHPKYSGKIIVRGVASGKQGLVIGLHGGGANYGDGSEAAQKYAHLVSKGYIGIFPTVLQKRALEWAGYPEEEQYIIELIRAAIRTFSIDTNRVILIGGSMGGYGAWHVGGHYADVFAGISSQAGGILGGESRKWGGGILANLYHTPVWFLHGAKDEAAPVGADQRASKILAELKAKYGGYEHKYIEYPDLGHSVKREDVVATMDYLAQRKRTPLPKKVIWEPLRKPKCLFYWLAVDEPKDGSHFEVEIKGNEIDVTGDGPLSLLLNDKLVNLSKKVIVRRNGQEVYNDLAPYSASAILQSVAEKIDPEIVLTARIDLP